MNFTVIPNHGYEVVHNVILQLKVDLSCGLPEELHVRSPHTTEAHVCQYLEHSSV